VRFLSHAQSPTGSVDSVKNAMHEDLGKVF